MEQTEFHEFMKAQEEEILRYVEGKKDKQRAIHAWIKRKAKKFSKKWTKKHQKRFKK